MQANTTLQAVMFDMDGLLVDSEPLWFEAEAAIMDRMGSSWGPADQQHLIGGSLTRSTAYMQGKAAQSVPQEVIAGWLLRGMADLVRARGVQVMPGSNKDRVDGRVVQNLMGIGRAVAKAETLGDPPGRGTCGVD